MKIMIEFDTDNAAFENDRDTECARILRLVADRIANGETSGRLRDINGNDIGTWEAVDAGY